MLFSIRIDKLCLYLLLKMFFRVKLKFVVIEVFKFFFGILVFLWFLYKKFEVNYCLEY